jgi:glyoxylase I family protein
MGLEIRDVTTLLEVFDMPRSIAFYRDTLGFEVEGKLFFACPDPEAAYRHLLGRGVAIDEPRVSQYGMKQLWLTDPDGFRLCFQWPTR